MGDGNLGQFYRGLGRPGQSGKKRIDGAASGRRLRKIGIAGAAAFTAGVRKMKQAK
jgi:hypothetical protein